MITIEDAGVIVNISRETRSPDQRGFGSMLFVYPSNSTTIPNMRKYTSFQEVADDYDSHDAPYNAALFWFSQEPMPRDFYVGKGAVISPGQKASGSLTFNSSGVAAGDGVAGLEIGGELFTVSPANGDTAAQVVDALVSEVNASGLRWTASIGSSPEELKIEAKFTGDYYNGFPITDKTTDTGLGGAIVISPNGGQNAQMEPIQDTLDTCASINNNFYCVSLDRMYRGEDSQIIGCAEWVEANERLFFAVSNSIDILNPVMDSDIASKLKDRGFVRTMIMYSADEINYPEIGAFGILATTSFRGTRTLKTLKFKDVRLAARQEISAGDLGIIKDKRCNVFYETAGIRMFDDGITPGGEWIDVIHGADALAEEIRVRVFGLLSRTSTKIPYTDNGMALIKAEVEAALQMYMVNGYISDGVDENGDYLPPYTVFSKPVALAPQADKSRRIAPDVQFTARLASAIHAVTINGTLTL